jgi:hypothetical protein
VNVANCGAIRNKMPVSLDIFRACQKDVFQEVHITSHSSVGFELVMIKNHAII